MLAHISYVHFCHCCHPFADTLAYNSILFLLLKWIYSSLGLSRNLRTGLSFTAGVFFNFFSSKWLSKSTTSNGNEIVWLKLYTFCHFMTKKTR